MGYYVESDGDRTPKDVYVCHSDGAGRVFTMEQSNEQSRFYLARRICALLNGSDAGFNLDSMRKCGSKMTWKISSNGLKT